MDTSGLYERQSGQWRWVYDVVTMGTYRLTSNSTQQLTGKFLRRFSPFLIPTPSEATIKHIFGVAVSLFLIRKQFHREIILMADKVSNPIHCYWLLLSYQTLAVLDSRYTNTTGPLRIVRINSGTCLILNLFNQE